MTLSWIDVLIIFSFIGFAVFIGLRSHKQASKNLEEYFLAGRSLKGWQAGLSMAASQFAADTPLWITGLVATGGIFLVWRVWIYGVAFMIIAFLLGPCWRRAKVITDAELTELRYGQRPAAILRGVKAIYFGIVYNCTALAIVFLATTRIVEPFLLWNQWLPADVFNLFVSFVQFMGTPLTIATPGDPDVWIRSANNFISILSVITVTTFYTTTGGLRSVVATDIVLFIIKMVGVIIYLAFILGAVGGLSAIPVKLHDIFASGAARMTADQILAFTPDQAGVSTILIAVIAIQWMTYVAADGSGYLAQRNMACRTERDVKQAMVIFTVTQLLVRNLMWIVIALGLIILFPPDFNLSDSLYKASREATYIDGIATLLPTGVKGLLLTGMLAALATTVDTHMNWGASYISNDIYRRFICEGLLKKEPSDRSLVWVARCSTILVLGTAILIMTRMTAIQMAQEIIFMLGAGIGPVLLMRWFWWRTTSWSEIASIASAMVLAPFLILNVHGANEPWRILILGTTSVSMGILASYVFGPESMEQLKAFYNRAKPPGFWGPVALACGEEASAPMQRLTSGLVAVGSGVVSVFSLMVGFGTLLVGSPAPAWFPFREAWIVSLIVLGFALTPIWIKAAFQGAPVSKQISREEPIPQPTA